MKAGRSESAACIRNRGIWNLKNGCLHTDTGEIDYIRFGCGERVLVMIPGVGDGLKTVKGMALPFALLYRTLLRDFTVYAFSRRRNLSPRMSTREMAGDLNLALETLGLAGVSVVGVSQGGMIAQWLAIDHPDKTARLVLAVTLSRPNHTVRDAVGRWLEMARERDYEGILMDTAERSYSQKRIRQARIMYRLLGKIGKPRSFRRFMIQAQSCVTHDAYEDLGQITCPVLVIGGTDDRIVSGEASREIAKKIPHSRLIMHEGLGHGLYEESPDFLKQVKEFCKS